MPEFNANVWSPWRMEYIESLDGVGDKSGCFLCRYQDDPGSDAVNHVLWRSPRTLVLLNRFPYTNGHMLVAPTAHLGSLDEVPDDVLIELTFRIREAQRVLRDAVNAHGFNIGINLGHCAGAGLPQHVHWHIVPRWNGDTSYMAAIGAVRLIPQSLEAVHARFVRRAAELGLPRAGG